MSSETLPNQRVFFRNLTTAHKVMVNLKPDVTSNAIKIGLLNRMYTHYPKYSETADPSTTAFTSKVILFIYTWKQ